MFWRPGDDSINFLAELTTQKRQDDLWLSEVLEQCRDGKLGYEDYCFLHGLPTKHCGSWLSLRKESACGVQACSELCQVWEGRARARSAWADQSSMECSVCAAERVRRNRLVDDSDPRLRQPPFIDSPFIHQHNEPKYHVLLLRAVEHAKRNMSGPQHILWLTAQDTPVNPDEIADDHSQVEKKRIRWLQFHDQRTGGIPGLLPLYHGMRARVTERVSKKLHILKHCPCVVDGWDLHSADKAESEDGERLLQYLPNCIYVRFEGAAWRVHPDLQPGVFPLKPKHIMWTLNHKTGAKVQRRGFTLLPDYACTAHMVQGMTFQGAMADFWDFLDNASLKDMLAAYIAASRVRVADGLLVLRAFSHHLFQQGPPPGPHCLMKLLQARCKRGVPPYTEADALAEYATLKEARDSGAARRKQAGHTWTCFDCDLAYPAEGFDAHAHRPDDIYRKCVAPGCWLACSACAAAHMLVQGHPDLAERAILRCGRCGQIKKRSPHRVGAQRHVVSSVRIAARPRQAGVWRVPEAAAAKHVPRRHRVRRWQSV